MDKIDFKKTDKIYYTGKVGRYDVLEIPQMRYLMVDGQGAPGGPAYSKAVAALYGLSYNLKFHCKKTLEKDHVVPPLNGFWWADDMDAFINDDRDAWKWTMALRQPDYIDGAMLEELRGVVIAKTAKKKDAATDEATLQLARIEDRVEGLVVQILHVGSYADETPVLAKMHNEVIPELGMRMRGLHHEIYLGDPRRVPPEKLKTILRQPVEKS